MNKEKQSNIIGSGLVLGTAIFLSVTGANLKKASTAQKVFTVLAGAVGMIGGTSLMLKPVVEDAKKLHIDDLVDDADVIALKDGVREQLGEEDGEKKCNPFPSWEEKFASVGIATAEGTEPV